MMTLDIFDLLDNAAVQLRFVDETGSFHREVRWPGADITDLPEDVRAAIAAHWTPARVSAYEAEQAEARKPDPVTTDMINAERARRIAAGTVIGNVYVTGRDEDARNLMALALAAQMRLASGDDETVTIFRDGDNVDHELTPSQVLHLWQESAAFVSHLYAKSWEIKELDPLPDDITENELWN